MQNNKKKSDMPIRTIMFIVMVTLALLFIVYLRKYSLYYPDAGIFFWYGFGIYEMTMAIRKANYKPMIIPIIIGSALIYALMLVYNIYSKPMEIGLAIGFGITILFTLIWFTFNSKKDIKDLTSTFFIFIYPTVMVGFFFIVSRQTGQLMGVMMAFLYSILTDTFAYLFGVTFKGPKLCPKISPKKTIAGAIGGIIGGLVSSLILFLLFDKFDVFTGIGMDTRSSLTSNQTTSIIIYVFFGILASILAEIGDLAASRIKRTLGIKDFGKIFPGHGGVLDRIDSFIFVVPAICILFNIIDVVGA